MSNPRKLPALEILVLTCISCLMLGASALGIWPISLVEALGFATGGFCVWLTVREHIWNFPVGLANNCFFFVLFFQARLFADMGLQVIYFALGIWGWANWLHGGEERSELRITATPRREWLALLILVPILTWLLREILIVINGAAPFWDSLTTILCLAAQYLLCRKRIENWAFWIAADAIYVPLYASRGLYATAALYGVFLLLCIIGARAWFTILRGAITNERVQPA